MGKSMTREPPGKEEDLTGREETSLTSGEISLDRQGGPDENKQ